MMIKVEIIELMVIILSCRDYGMTIITFHHNHGMIKAWHACFSKPGPKITKIFRQKSAF